MTTATRKCQPATRIGLPARFDILTSAAYRIVLARFLRDPEATLLRVDCRDLEYIDSVGIGTLLSWQSLCRQMNKSMALENCDPSIMRVLRLAGVRGSFTFATAAVPPPVPEFRYA